MTGEQYWQKVSSNQQVVQGNIPAQLYFNIFKEETLIEPVEPSSTQLIVTSQVQRQPAL